MQRLNYGGRGFGKRSDEGIGVSRPIIRDDGELYAPPPDYSAEWKRGYADAIDKVTPAYEPGWTLIQRRDYDAGFDAGTDEEDTELGPHR